MAKFYMDFPRWFFFPLGDFILFFLPGCLMQIMMMAYKFYSNKQK